MIRAFDLILFASVGQVTLVVEHWVVVLTATADSGSSTSLVVELLELVGLILRLITDAWLVSRSELEAGFWALVIVVGELLLVPVGVSIVFWPISWSILEIGRSWLMVMVGLVVVVVAEKLEAGGGSLVIVGGELLLVLVKISKVFGAIA